mmetsp:Transcript_90157/g.232721  ORF Transcript_90157/g.232721 Transcript_90157/m.232721 type:complete len:205 (+) Transcript_90157:1184-1798(+)
MATKLTCPCASCLLFRLVDAFLIDFFARSMRFSRFLVFLEPTRPLMVSLASSSSSSSLSSRMPSRPLVLLPRKRWASAAAIFTSGCTRPALIMLTTCRSLQTFCRYSEMKPAQARRETSLSPSRSCAKKKSLSSTLIFWLRVFVFICTMSRITWVKMILRRFLSCSRKSLKYSGIVSMQGNWLRFLSRMSACTRVCRICGCITS